MKAFVCDKVREDSPYYFKRGWVVPHDELEAKDWIIVESWKITGTFTDYFIQNYQQMPTVIFFWTSNDFIQTHFIEICATSWTKCIYIDDLHQPSGKIISFRNMVWKKFDYIFSTYGYVFPKFYPNVQLNKIIWYPHCVNPSFKIDINDNPSSRILLSGCIEPNYYPFRCHVKNLVKKYPIDVLPHLSYRTPNHQMFGAAYIKYISKYIAAVACCSTAYTPYIVNKFFEIPASGALLLAYDEHVKKPLAELGFIDGENYISVNYDNIAEKILYVTHTSNKEEVDRIRNKGYQLVWNRHTLWNRAELINQTVDKV